MTNPKQLSDLKENRRYAFLAFAINLLIALIIFVPFIISGKGLFTLSDDFNAQELAFNVFANREIKELDVFFNWAIDIGSDFISSFSFYNLGSPFFWITLPFKPEAFPYLIGWILALKYAVAGFTSYLWLSRYTGKRAALAGSVLYAFSGFQHMNMIFYHFHDVVAFFPLLLIGLEERVDKKRKGVFAAGVAINALVNWNFFIGEVIFVILFYMIRYDILLRFKKKEIKEEIFRILSLFGEGVLGVGVSAVLFIPSAYAMLSNSRINEHISMRDGVIWSAEDLIRLIRGFLLPSESMNHNSTLSYMNWYSVSLYLPMIGGVFALVYFFRKRKANDWLCKMLLICAVISLVPAVNNIFVLFTPEPYRRWYYMYILMLSLASAKLIDEYEECAENDKKIKKQIVSVSLILTASIGLLWIMLANWPWDYEGNTAIIDSEKWTMTALMGMVGLLVLVGLILIFKKRQIFTRILIVGISGWSILTGISGVIQYKEGSELDSKAVYDLVMNTGAEMDRNPFPYRYGVLDYYGYFNLGMANSLPTMDSFISTVDSGIFEFYDMLGVHRHTLTPTGPIGTDRLLSLKYWITKDPWGTELPMDDLIGIYDNGSDYIYLVEDYYALPIGFTYDRYITRSEFLEIPVESRAIAMLTSLVVKDEDENKVSGILTHADAAQYATRNGVIDPALDIYGPEHTQKEFSFGRKSFGSTIECFSDKYAFYSVPYSDRWSATVNGEPVEILNINGLMAVPVKEGVNVISFDYSCLINLASLIISMISFAVMIVIIIVGRKKDSAGDN